MTGHLVCLTFDFDTWSGMVARGLNTPTYISRGEFGAVASLRILDLLARHKIRSTWFTPGVVISAYPDHCRRVVAEGHEMGNHGWTHDPPATLNRDEEGNGLRRASDIIEATTGLRPRGYRSPSWDLSEHTIDLLLAQGFEYDSSMMGHDFLPYQARRGDIVPKNEPVVFGEETPIVEMPISWNLDDFPHFEFLRTSNQLLPGLMNGRLVLENWLDEFDYMKSITDWGVLTYTFHPYVIGRGHRMLVLERLIQGLTERGATFVTMADAVDAYRKR